MSSMKTFSITPRKRYSIIAIWSIHFNPPPELRKKEAIANIDQIEWQASGPSRSHDGPTPAFRFDVYAYVYACEPLVPPGFDTVTETVPVPDGATALIVASSMIVNEAGLGPKNTSVAVEKPVPVRVTLLPPVMLPVVGDKLVSVGAFTYRNEAPLLVAASVLTVTALTPAVPAGEVAVIALSELAVKPVAGVAPK